MKKHWPESEIYDDIRTITANSEGKQDNSSAKGRLHAKSSLSDREPIFLLTGGFPCQPFSAAGLRRGTADERHLWPEMLRVIKLTQPEWVIAENVRGILTWNEGLVFEQVCADLETAGYSVWPLIIPAVAVNAPHRRDRVWFVAHAKNADDRGNAGELSGKDELQAEERQEERTTELSSANKLDATDSGHSSKGTAEWASQGQRSGRSRHFTWDTGWLEVATELCGVDDGLPARLDGFELTKPKHRQERLKSLGNAIVPQVAIEIIKAMIPVNEN